MIRSLLHLLLAFAASFPVAAAAGPFPNETGSAEVRISAADSVLTAEVKKMLGAGLEEYFRALEAESVEVKKQESDFIIGECKLDEVRQFTALKVYSHFLESPVMGDEAVAIHVYDTWFASGKVKMGSEVEMLNAGVFAEFNRSSLIGMRAPALTLYGPDGLPGTVFPLDSSVSPLKSSRLKLLYFFDTGCARCRVMTPALHSALSSHDWPLDVYAVYVGRDPDKWASFRDAFDAGVSPSVEVFHFNDPELESDFQKLYGVLQTPKMFLVGSGDVIIGRNLDVQALGRMMEAEAGGAGHEYGGEESAALFNRLLPGDRLSRDEILAVAEDISTVTLKQGDTLGYKHLEGDFLYWLTSRRGEEVKDAQKEFIDSYITGSGLYTTRSDSLQVLSLAGLVSSLYALSPTGSRIPGITVPGKLLSYRGMKEGKFNLARLRGRPSYILFYSERCSSCAAELSAADSLSRLPSFRKARFLLVDVDDILANSPALGRSLLEHFDISSTPYLLETDRKGIIKRRYFSLKDSL